MFLMVFAEIDKEVNSTLGRAIERHKEALLCLSAFLFIFKAGRLSILTF